MPNTYMNESGRSIGSALKWFDLTGHQMLVIVDDMDLPLGKLRVRDSGGSGGHNGLRSIIQHLGSQDFCRLRIGIGSPSQIPEERKEKTVSHVLGEFKKKEIPIVEEVLDTVISGLALMKKSGFAKGSTYLNSFNATLKI